METVNNLKPFGKGPLSVPQALTKSVGLSPLTPPPSDEAGQLQMNGLLFSACLETETASASNFDTNGLSAFSYAFIESLKTLGLGASSNALIQASAEKLKVLNFRQTPLLKEPVSPNQLSSKSFCLLSETSEKFFPGFETLATTLVPIIVNRVLDELLKKGYQPAAAPEKFFPGFETLATTLVPIIVNRVLDELLKKGYRF